jgi:hypothetical protein
MNPNIREGLPPQHPFRTPSFEFAIFAFPRPFGEAKFRPALTGGVYSIVGPDAFNIQPVLSTGRTLCTGLGVHYVQAEGGEPGITASVACANPE